MASRHGADNASSPLPLLDTVTIEPVRLHAAEPQASSRPTLARLIHGAAGSHIRRAAPMPRQITRTAASAARASVHGLQAHHGGSMIWNSPRPASRVSESSPLARRSPAPGRWVLVISYSRFRRKLFLASARFYQFLSSATRPSRCLISCQLGDPRPRVLSRRCSVTDGS